MHKILTSQNVHINSRVHNDIQNSSGKSNKRPLKYKRGGTLLQTAEDIVSQLGLNADLNEDQVLVHGKEASGKVAVSKIRKSQQRKNRERWEARSVHGAVC